MSIIHSSEIGWLLSHESYVNNVYNVVKTKEDVVCKYQLNPDLFKIEFPFGKSRELSSTNKRLYNFEDFNDLNVDIKEVEKLFDIFKQEKEKCNLFPVRQTVGIKNSEASFTAEQIYQKLGKIPMSNISGENSRDDAIIVSIDTENYLFPPRSRFYCKNISELGTILTNETYDLIVLDPPWWNKYVRRKKSKNIMSAYEMMYTEELKILPIEDLLSDGGIVIIWCTNSYQNQSILLNNVFPKWKLNLHTKWFWLKITTCGDTVCSFSKPPGKQPFEQIFIASKNKELKIPKSKLIISVPSALHSHKPPLLEVLKEFLPNQPKCLEIFARYLLPGWTSWGLEVIKFQHESLYI